MPPSFREFSTWILQNISYREGTDEYGNIVFNGNHVSPRYLPPIRNEGESETSFQDRQKEFKKHLPRGSTVTMCVALAYKGFLKSGCTQREAAAETLKQLRRVAEQAGLYKREVLRELIAWRDIKHSIGTSRRSYRTARKKTYIPPVREEQRAARNGTAVDLKWLRNIESVRSLANRFCGPPNTQSTFDQMFDAWYESYLSDNPTDEWLQRVEPKKRAHFERIKKDPEMSESPMLAFFAGSLGQMYWQFGRTAEAEELYKFAEQFWILRGDQWPRLKASALPQLQARIADIRCGG
jgi:hypothetical protein